ncbi:hypothetical protein TSTA_004060 [Talaromyces stipitatus ATCC 10500]|uniref:Aldehyde dehydrogenase domain-containing protein n=1 Tax=Talaromyces stipitatus (strain ATCC 10500 / CBS 375.48 / QM 6759 / NRRL 1006) TaxID=441959 RepID=B8MTA4_TALSN|nr:uncharacterized protein TSTA_004060 [Talaromyces stipitatus ATCC 10500]EED12354.1 hypothetical protein TSTA_004060 [Talaromyces stipitatus ATCC 10500]
MLTAGKRKGDNGYFIAPTIFLNFPDDNDVVTKEILGPLSPSSLSRLRKLLSEPTTPSLFSSFFTRDIFRALPIAKQHKSGTVTINCTSLPSPRYGV